jgi:hypothetical protein
MSAIDAYMTSPKAVFFLDAFVALAFAIYPQMLHIEILRTFYHPDWLPTARFIGVSIVLIMFYCSWLFEYRLRPQIIEDFRQKDEDPDRMIFLITMSSCMSATIIGMVLYVIGASTEEARVFAGWGIAGMMFQAWRYRRLLTTS